MKQLAALFAFTAALGASAQCVPNQLYADSVYGVWPDTVTNFAHGYANTFYSDTLQMLVPTDAGLVDPQGAGFTIDSIALDEVAGLPPGFYVNCVSQTTAPCTYLPSVVGCGLIEGTTDSVGVFDLTINVTVYLLAGFVQQQVSFPGYRIVIEEPNSIADAVVLKPTDVRAVPNPADAATNIQFGLSRAAQAHIRVYNMVGEKLWDRTVQGKSGANNVRIDASTMGSGIYLYTVEAGSNTFTGRLVVN